MQFVWFLKFLLFVLLHYAIVFGVPYVLLMGALYSFAEAIWAWREKRLTLRLAAVMLGLSAICLGLLVVYVTFVALPRLLKFKVH